MTEAGIMPIAVQRRGVPQTRTLVRAALDLDLAYLIALGYEFPRVLIVAGAFGIRVAGPLP